MADTPLVQVSPSHLGARPSRVAGRATGASDGQKARPNDPHMVIDNTWPWVSTVTPVLSTMRWFNRISESSRIVAARAMTAISQPAMKMASAPRICGT